MVVPKLRFREFEDEWSIMSLNDVSDIYDGTHETPDYKESGIKFVSVEDIRNFDNTSKFITIDAFNRYKKKPKFNDIFMTRIGDIGTSNILKSNDDYAYYVSLSLIRTKNNINPDYLNQYIGFNNFQRELWNRTIHVAFPKKINLGEIGNCKITIPSFQEQTRIANFLSSLDKKIELQTKKIEALKLYKKGLFEKLFTYTSTFDSRIYKLNELGNPYSGLSGKTKEDFNHGSSKFIPYMSVFKNTISENNLQLVDVKGDEKQNKVKKGDLLFTISSETKEEVGMCANVNLNINNLYLNSFCFGFRISNSNKVNYEYLNYLLLTKKYRRLISNLGQGFTRVNISKNKLLELKVPMPNINIQSEIIPIINLFFKKEKAELIKLNNLNELKKGLMQNIFV